MTDTSTPDPQIRYTKQSENFAVIRTIAEISKYLGGITQEAKEHGFPIMIDGLESIQMGKEQYEKARAQGAWVPYLNQDAIVDIRHPDILRFCAQKLSDVV